MLAIFPTLMNIYPLKYTYSSANINVGNFGHVIVE